MPHVLAVVSKAVYEKSCKSLMLGDVWPTDRYLSQNPNLNALAAGGDLYLCTVRPGDLLWRVAVLRAPTVQDGAWVAVPNTEPIVDLTEILSQLRFSTGKGVTADPGKLGMSLQTPRQLIDSDVVLLERPAASKGVPTVVPVKTKAKAVKASATPSSAPAPTPSKSPKAAPRAKEVGSAPTLDDLPAALRAEALEAATKMKKAPKQAVKALKALAKKVGQTQDALTILDWAADEALASGDIGVGAAAEAFEAARVIAGKLATPPVSVARALAFATPFAMTVKAASLWLQSKPGDGALALLVAVLDTPALELDTDFAKAADALGLLEEAFATAPGGMALDRAGDDFWTPAAPALGRALARSLPTRRWASGYRPFRARQAQHWLTALALGGTAGLTPAERAQRLHNAAHAVYGGVDDVKAAAFRVLAREAGKVDPVAPWRENSIDMELLDILLAEGVPVLPPPRRNLNFGLHAWGKRKSTAPSATLSALAADPDWSKALAASLLTSFDRATDPAANFEAAIASPALRPAVDGVVAWVRRLATHGTIAALEQHLKLLQTLARPAFLDAVPDLAAAIAAIDLAALLQRQLRAGVLDEWGYPAADAVVAGLGDPSQIKVGFSFPCVTLRSPARFVVLGPDGVLLDRPAAATDLGLTGTLVGGKLVFSKTPGGAYPTWTEGDTTWEFTRDGRLAWPDGTAGFRSFGRPPAPMGVTRAGKAVGACLPAWMAAAIREGEGVVLRDAHHFPVPAGSEDSPVGTVNNQYGFAVFRTDDHDRARDIDGREVIFPFESAPEGLFTFPGRAGLYSLHSHGHVQTPDGTPLVPKDQGPRYWGGTIRPWPVTYWPRLRPRDLPGSAALASLSLAAAQALFAAAQADAGADRSRPQPFGDYADLNVTITAPVAVPTGIEAWPDLAATLPEALPGVTHPLLRLGIARIALAAAALAEPLQGLKASSAATAGPRSDFKVPAAFAQLCDYHHDLWWNRPHNALGQQLVDAADMLFAGAPLRPLASCKLAWECLLDIAPSVLWRAIAGGTSDTHRVQLVDLLRAYVATPFSSDARVQSLVVQLDSLPPWMDAENPVAVVPWDGQPTLVRAGRGLFVHAVQVVGADGPALPADAVLVSQTPAVPSAAMITAALARLEADGPVPHAPTAVAHLAARTGLTAPAAALLWAAALNPWAPDQAGRKRIGLSKAEAELAQAELGRHDLGPAFLLVPLEKAWDAPLDLAEALAERWLNIYGGRVPLDPAIGVRLAADMHDPSYPVDLDQRTLLDPDARPMLTVDADWVPRPFSNFGDWGGYEDTRVPPGWPRRTTEDPANKRWPDPAPSFSGTALHKLTPLVAWAYQELPVGHALRIGAHHMAQRIQERLAHPGLLVMAQARRGGLEAARSRIQGPAVQVEGPCPLGIDRGDLVLTWPEAGDGYFLALRPSKATAATWADLDALAHPDAFDIDHASLVRLWQTPEWQSLVAALVPSDLPDGAYAADPRHYGPVPVRAGLDEDTTVVLTLIEWLAEATPARLERFSGFSRAKISQHIATLAAAGLVEELVDGGKRRLILPGPRIQPKGPARAIEANKAAPYGIREGKRALLGVALPLQPFG